jgi:hypothetical protein
MWALWLACAFPAQDAGLIEWKKGEPNAALLAAKERKRPVLLYFTTFGSARCQALAEGAFSDPKVVEASSDLDCVIVHCEAGTRNPLLQQRYGVRSWPTVLLCDPDGQPLDALRTGEPEAVATQLRRFVARMKGEDPDAEARANPPPPPFADFSPQALLLARRAGKPLLVYFYDDSPASISTHLALADPVLRPVAPRFLVSKKPYAKADPVCVKFKVERAPTILILDASLERPEDAPLARIGGSRGPRELLRELEAVRAGREGAEPEIPTGGPRPLLTPDDEKMSDDELDRQFIHAQIRIAEEWLNKNRKDKAKETLNELLKNYPKHRASQEARKLLEKLN